MLSASHQLPANLAAAPAILVIGIEASSRNRVLAAEAILCRTHLRTRWTRTSMACRWTWMRALLRNRSRSRARLSAREWRQSRKWLGVHLFLTPTRKCSRQLIFRQIAARTAPLPWWGQVSVLSLLSCCRRTFLARPRLDALHVEHGPARPARPCGLSPRHLVVAYGALVVAVVDIFVGSCGDVWGV